MSKELTYLVIHCAATPEGVWFDQRDILKWHLEERGWKKPGYSDLILLDGCIVNLIPYDDDDIVDNWEISNGAKGYNGISRHICYIGGTDSNGKAKDTRTDIQLREMEHYVKYFISKHPNIKIIGHNQISSKSCPSFNVPKWLRSIGVKKKNIGL